MDFDTIIKKYNIRRDGVIHVGMHQAEEYPLYKNAGFKNILFIEANEELAHGWKNDDDNCYVVCAAISDKIEEVDFNITNNGQSSSILKLGDHAWIYPGIVNIKTVKIKTTTLDNVLSVVPVEINNWNMMNLDIQGVELQAMRGFSNWEFIDSVFTEVNYREMYKGCSLEPELTAFLNSKGFEKVEEYNTGQGWGDAFYIK